MFRVSLSQRTIDMTKEENAPKLLAAMAALIDSHTINMALLLAKRLPAPWTPHRREKPVKRRDGIHMLKIDDSMAKAKSITRRATYKTEDRASRDWHHSSRTRESALIVFTTAWGHPKRFQHRSCSIWDSGI